MTIIDGGCARFARGVWCKIFIILAYSKYRRYKYSSCTPPGCYEICCYLFSEGTLMRPPVIAEVSPPGNTYKYGCCVCLYNIRGNTHKYELLCMSSTIFSRGWKISLLGGAQRTHADLAQHSAHHSPAHRDACTYHPHPTPAASSTHEAQIYIMRASYPGGVVAVITGGCGAYPRMGAAYA